MIDDDQAVHERRVADKRCRSSGLRSGAPAGSVNRPKRTNNRQQPKGRIPQPARFPERKAAPSRAAGASPVDLPARDICPSRGSMIRSVTTAMMIVRTTTDAIENQRLAVRSMRERGVDHVNGVVGDLREHGVKRLDQHIHGERAGDAGKSQGQSGKRMATDAQQGRACQWNQDQIAGIRRDAGEDADKRQNVSQSPVRGHGNELADQRIDQTSLLGHAHADHGDDQQTNSTEAQEVRHQPGVDVANAIDRQQTICGGLCRLDFVRIWINDLIAKHLLQADTEYVKARSRWR